jgi:hypothetical protein
MSDYDAALLDSEAATVEQRVWFLRGYVCGRQFGMDFDDADDVLESSEPFNPFQEKPMSETETAAPAASTTSSAKAVLDEITKVVNTLAPLVEQFAALVPVAGADIKLGLACLQGGVDAADASVDAGASVAATILATLKGALAGL